MAEPRPLRQPPAVEAFGAGGFRVSGERYDGSILILDDVVRAWPVRTLAELEPHHFYDVITAGLDVVEIVLLGTGVETMIAPRPVREAMAAAGFGLEVMNTPEACRLYNVLASDGRRVAACLLAV
ncbi:MAG: Mth938-like domain-containing protein [Caulobacteraceae bacterium]